VGDGPQGIDQNLDSSKLVVCPFGSEFIEVVDLAAVPPARILKAEIPPTADSSTRRAWETGVAANGKAFFTSSYGGTGQTAVWQLTLATGSVVARLDVPDIDSHIWEPGNFAVSGDRERVFIGAGAVSSGAVHRYVSSTDSFLPRVDTHLFFDHLSTNADGTRLSMVAAGIVMPAQIYDQNVTFLGQVTEWTRAAAFSPNSTLIYWTPATGTAVLVASDATTFSELFRIALPSAPKGGAPTRGIAANAAGNRVFVLVDGGVAVVDVP
jgi:hypothetical protein